MTSVALRGKPAIYKCADHRPSPVRIPTKLDGVSNREAGRYSDLMLDSQDFVSLDGVDHR